MTLTSDTTIKLFDDGEVAVYDEPCGECGKTDWEPGCNPRCNRFHFDVLRISHAVAGERMVSIRRASVLKGLTIGEVIETEVAKSKDEASVLNRYVQSKRSMEST